MSRRPQSLWAAALLLAAVPAAHAPAQSAPLSPPARNWTLPLFTKEGFRQMTLQGDEVQPVTADRIEIKGMNVTVFSGGPDGKVDSQDDTFYFNQIITIALGFSLPAKPRISE